MNDNLQVTVIEKAAVIIDGESVELTADEMARLKQAVNESLGTILEKNNES